MKTYKAIILVLLFTTAANAQITKGNWMVGGNASFSSQETYSNKGNEDKIVERTIKITPNIGYFFVDKLAVGGRFGYENIFNPNYGFGDVSSNAFFVGPFLRYYFLKPKKIVNVFVEGSYGIGNVYRKGDTESQNYTEHINTYDFMAGPVIYFNSSVSMEFTLQYSSTRIKFQDSDFTRNNFQIGLGFQIYLEKNN